MTTPPQLFFNPLDLRHCLHPCPNYFMDQCPLCHMIDLPGRYLLKFFFFLLPLFLPPEGPRPVSCAPPHLRHFNLQAPPPVSWNGFHLMIGSYTTKSLPAIPSPSARTAVRFPLGPRFYWFELGFFFLGWWFGLVWLFWFLVCFFVVGFFFFLRD